MCSARGMWDAARQSTENLENRKGLSTPETAVWDSECPSRFHEGRCNGVGIVVAGSGTNLRLFAK